MKIRRLCVARSEGERRRWDHIFDPYGPHKPAGINLDWMKVGIAPTGKDGYPVEIHHMYQKDRGPLVEVLKSEHKGHLHGRKARLGNKLVDATFRIMYWQERANQIEYRSRNRR